MTDNIVEWQAVSRVARELNWLTPTQAVLFVLCGVLTQQFIAYQRGEVPVLLTPADALWNIYILVRGTLERSSRITEVLSRQRLLDLLKEIPPALLRELAAVSREKLDTTDPDCWAWEQLLAQAQQSQPRKRGYRHSPKLA